MIIKAMLFSVGYLDKFESVSEASERYCIIIGRILKLCLGITWVGVLDDVKNNRFNWDAVIFLDFIAEDVYYHAVEFY